MTTRVARHQLESNTNRLESQMESGIFYKSGYLRKLCKSHDLLWS